MGFKALKEWQQGVCAHLNTAIYHKFAHFHYNTADPANTIWATNVQFK